MGGCIFNSFFFLGKTNDECRCKRRTKFARLVFAIFVRSLILCCAATNIYIYMYIHTEVQYKYLYT